jgi:hypothetical protein
MSIKIFKLLFPHFFVIYNFVRQIFCKHNYEYWDTDIENVNNDGTLTFIQRISKTHRKCEKCQKSQRFDMRVGKTGWKMTSSDFPASGEAFTHYLNPKGQKTIWEEREKTIDRILDC